MNLVYYLMGIGAKYLIFGKYNTKYKYNSICEVNNEIVPRCKSALYLGNLFETENIDV